MLGLGISLARGAFASIITYVKDGLKLFYNFTEHQDNPISHASTGSCSFDGTDDYIESGSNVGITGASAKSGCAWIYPTAVDDHAVIFDWGEAASGKANQFKLFEESANTCKLRFDANGTNATGTTVFAVNTWYHVAFTYDGDKIRVYVNGSLEDTSSSITCNSTDSHLIIGNGQPSNSQWFTGSICNVGVWSRALSASEIQGIMYKQYSELGSVDKASLVSWWGLDEDYDDAHGSNDGTNSGSTLTNSVYGDNAPQIPRILDVAQPKQAVQLADGSTDFDGTDDYIDCGTGLGTTLGDNYAGSLTVSLWFKSDVFAGDGSEGMFNLSSFSDSLGEFNITATSADGIRFGLNADGWYRKYTFSDTTSWHHLVCIYDTSGESNSLIYLDGASVSTATSGSFPADADMDFSGLKTIIGAYYSTSYTFNGKIANVGIWSSALTQSQVQELMFTEKYAGLSSGLKTNLVSWYDLGDTSLGSNLVTSWANRGAVPYETFTSSGANITNAINTTGSSQVHAEVNLEVGKQYEITVDLTLDSGTAPFVGFQDAVGGSGGSVDAQLLSAGENTITTVAVANDNFLMFNNNATTTEFSAVVTLKEVLATDSQGSNDGSIYGATTTTGYTSSPHGVVDPINYGTIKSGTALSFDGTNDYVKIDSAIGDLGSSCTFSAWIYRNNTSDYHYIFDARNNSGSGYIQGNTGDTTINKSSGTIYVDGVASSTLATGGWHHLAITGMTINITQDVMIGVHLGGSSFTFPGKISNVKIFNSALTESEIQEMYLNPEQILPTGVASSNLKIHLPLNEGVGTTVYDGSGNQNHATLVGATWDTANTDIAQVGLVRQNSPMVFDGSDDVVTITGIDVSYPQLSISVWFYGNTAGGGDHLFGITGTDTLNVYMTHGGGDTYVFRYGSGTSSISQTSTFTEGEWHHAVFIADSTNNVVKVYQNGTEIQSSAQTFDTPVYGAGFHIGARGAVGSPVNTFNDNINEVAVWDVTLDADAITALYNSGTPLDATADSGNYDNSGDLQGYWRNDNDTTWTDRSTNSNDGTVAGSPDSIVLTEGLTSGRDSQGFYLTDTTENCLTLNGAEYVEIPDSEVLSFDSQFTVECWAKWNIKSSTNLAGNEVLVSQWDNSSNNAWRLVMADNRKLFLDASGDGGTTNKNRQDASSAIEINVWTHLLATYSSGTTLLYINGSLVSSSGTGSQTSIFNSTANLNIGSMDGVAGDKMSGMIDDVRLYSNKALSSDEVTKNWNAGKSKHS